MRLWRNFPVASAHISPLCLGCFCPHPANCHLSLLWEACVCRASWPNSFLKSSHLSHPMNRVSTGRNPPGIAVGGRVCLAVQRGGESTLGRGYVGDFLTINREPLGATGWQALLVCNDRIHLFSTPVECPTKLASGGVLLVNRRITAFLEHSVCSHRAKDLGRTGGRRVRCIHRENKILWENETENL